VSGAEVSPRRWDGELADTDPRCARCDAHICSEGTDCFGHADEHLGLYRDDTDAGATADALPDELRRMHRAATAIEGRHYCHETRLGELILFAKEMGYTKLGVAFCIGLSEEAAVVERILSQDFDVVSVCCKVCGIDKADLELEQIEEGRRESICNSAGQAELLNDAGTDLNVICGLCVGHDSVFAMSSKAPVTTLIAKDRVLAHNPVGAIYCQYLRRRFEGDVGGGS